MTVGMIAVTPVTSRNCARVSEKIGKCRKNLNLSVFIILEDDGFILYMQRVGIIEFKVVVCHLGM